MNDYLSTIAFRTLYPAETLQPRRAGMFEPEPAGLEAIDTENGVGESIGHGDVPPRARLRGESVQMKERHGASSTQGEPLDLVREVPSRLDRSHPHGSRSTQESMERESPLTSPSLENVDEMRSTMDAAPPAEARDMGEGMKSRVADRNRHRPADISHSNDSPMVKGSSGRIALSSVDDRAPHGSPEPRAFQPPARDYSKHDGIPHDGISFDGSGMIVPHEHREPIASDWGATEIRPGGSLGYEIVKSALAMKGIATEGGATESQSGTIRVTIGRIDVRAVMPREPARSGPPAGKPAPKLSLEEYLREQKRRRG